MRIAIVKLSALGDIVHAMVVLQFIKKFNKEISIDWIVEESFKDLLIDHPHITNLHVVNLRLAKKKKSLLTLLEELKKIRNLESYDLVIDMQGLIKSGLISKLIPSKHTLGFDKDSARESVASIFYTKTFKCSYDTNIIHRNIALIEFALGFSVSLEEIKSKSAYLFANINKLNIKLTNTKKNILLIPGASHVSKSYPISKLAELTKLIDANFYIIWGNHDEEILANKIKNLSPRANICNKLKLNSLILLVSQLDLVIGPDTGPTHISWALNVPSITLFGATPGERNTIVTSKNKVIESQSKVNPYKINKNDNSIKEIPVEDIVDVAKQLLY
jgi:heptosyltransferase I